MFYAGIAAHPAFDRDRGGVKALITPIRIAKILQDIPLTFTVEVFYPKWYERLKYFATEAYTPDDDPNTLRVNGRWLERRQPPSLAKITATILHECVHAANAATPGVDFGHGDNKAAGKENTAPYWIGNYAYCLMTGQAMDSWNFLPGDR